MQVYVNFWDVQKMKSKHKKVKVYGKGEGQYILYKGIHVPLSDLEHIGKHEYHDMEYYKFNVFTYFYCKD